MLALLIAHLSVRGESAPGAFDAANRLYFEGKFSEAATTYGILEQSGQKSAALYFNWGNALFKSGQIGKAIAAYRQAKVLAPRDPDVLANLQFARNQRQGPTLSPPRSREWLHKLSLNEWAILAAASVWILFGALAFLQWRPVLRQNARSYLLVLGTVALLLCACAAAAVSQQTAERIAIVAVSDATVRKGPLEQSENAFTVHDGAEMRVLDSNNEWVQVEVDGPRSGWIRKDQVVLTE